MEGVLEAIERDRFSSLYDPGIYGVVTKLNNLGFVRTSFACCSGHPVNGSGKILTENGYILVAYNPYSHKSEEFHNKLREIRIEHKGIAVYFANAQKYSDLSERTGFLVKDSVATYLDVKIDTKTSDSNPNDTATALCLFWQKISDLITEYEKNPIRELLKPYYFGLRSNYGRIEATHPAFGGYYRYIPGYTLEKKIDGNSIDDKVQSPAQKGKEHKQSLAKILAVSILLYLGGAVTGFEAGAWYLS